MTTVMDVDVVVIVIVAVAIDAVVDVVKGEDEDGINGIVRKTMKMERKTVVKEAPQKIHKICVTDAV